MFKQLFRLSLVLVPFFLQTAEWEGVPVDYGGLTIWCPYSCVDEPELFWLAKPFDKAVQQVFERLGVYILNHRNEPNYLTAWVGKEGWYDIFDWPSINENWGDNAWGWPSFNIDWADYHRRDYRLNTYDSFLELSSLLRRDVDFYYLTIPQLRKKHLEALLPQLRAGYEEGYPCVDITDEGPKFSFRFLITCRGHELEYEIEYAERELQEIAEKEKKHQEVTALVNEAINRVDKRYKQLFVYCLQNHQEEGSKFKAALESLIMNDFEGAFEKISSLIDLMEKQNLGNDLVAKLYLLKGQLQSEFCLYGDAIIALTKSIQKNPDLKEAYFDRAAAYFELGKFDQAIEDYLASGYQDQAPKTRTEWVASAHLSAGVIAGILEGGTHSLVEFIPESLGTLRDLSKGLWVFANHPIDTSNAVAAAAVQCVNYLKENSSFDILQGMVPELRNLVQNYDQFSDFEKGSLIGQAIGKYGVDILLCKYSAKAVKAYLELKKANQAMTLKALATPATRQKVLEEAGKRWAHREAVLKNNNLKVEWDKQGKHVISHQNYRPERTRSIWECSQEKTQQLINDFAGTGVKAHGSGGHIPGQAGYQEIVDFGEIIGYEVELSTRVKTATTWGKIHYAKNGVHVVPYLPRSK